MPNRTKKFVIGESFAVKRTFTQTDFDRFAVLSGDVNPIHVDPVFAAKTRFGKTVAHGMFLFSNLSSLLWSHLSESDYALRSIEMMFPTPTYAGEEVEIQAEVGRMEDGGDKIDLAVAVTRPTGESGLVGWARVQKRGARLEANPFSPQKNQSAQTQNGLRLGQTAEKTRVFTPIDLDAYADLTGDSFNLGIPFGLLGGLISDLLGTELPGRGTNWLKQKFFFPSFAPVGGTITALVEIIRLRPEKNLVNLRTVCTAGERIVCVGEALVYVKDLEHG